MSEFPTFEATPIRWVFEGFGGLHLARRGRCSFAQKSAVSAAAGASALLVADFEASEETDAQVQTVRMKRRDKYCF